MRIKPTYLGIFILVVFMGTVYAFRAAGFWSVSGKVDRQGQAIQPLSGDTSTIKGWMTLEQISTAYNVPLAEILAAFGLPADTPASTPLNKLENETFSVSDLRTWLGGRTPFLPTAEPENPAPANPESEAAPENKAEPEPSRVPGEPAGAAEPGDHEPADRTVTGQTTFQDLLDWGVPAETIQQVIGGALPDPAMLVKDYVTQSGRSFGPVKNALQDAVPDVDD
jgi:hypothetical protein